MTLLLAFGLFRPVFAQEQPQVEKGLPAKVLSERAGYTIAYDHTTGNLELRNHKGDPVKQWETRGIARASAPLAAVPADRPLVVRFDNANSLLYDYDVTVEVVGQKRIRSCSNLGSQFSSAALLFGVGPLQGLASPSPGGASSFDGLLATLEGAVLPARGDAVLTEASLERTLDRIRPPLDSYLSFAESVMQLSISLPESLRRVALLAESEPIEPLLTALRSNVEVHGPALSDPASVPRVVEMRFQEIAAPLGALRQVNEQIRTGSYAGLLSDPAVLEARSLERSIESSLEGLAASYTQLQEALLTLQNALAESVQAFATGPSRGAYRRVILIISPTAAQPELPRFRAGEITVFTEPSVSVLCQFSFGFAVMGAPPEYVVENGMVVNRKEGNVRTAANLTFQVFSSSVPVGPLMGLGFGADGVDLYLGASIRLFDPMLLNLGAIWQREQRLPSGLEDGAPVPDPFQLDDLKKSFRMSFFAGIGFSP